MRGAITKFSSLYLTQGVRVEVEWPAFLESLASPYIRQTKDAVPGWSPATFESDSRAEGKRAVSVDALATEYDNTISVDEAVERWSRYFGCIYTTHSHTSESPRFRVVAPYSRSITTVEQKRVVLAAKNIGGPIDLRATIDQKRFWYMPSRRPAGSFEFRWLTGAVFDVESALASVPVSPPSPTATSSQSVGHVSSTPVIDRARAYLASMPPSISGSNGHSALFAAARVLVSGFELSDADALALLNDYNGRSQPAWDERDLKRKIEQAGNVESTKPRGWLLAAPRRVA